MKALDNTNPLRYNERVMNGYTFKGFVVMIRIWQV